LVFSLYATIKMMHGPINIRYIYIYIYIYIYTQYILSDWEGERKDIKSLIESSALY